MNGEHFTAYFIALAVAYYLVRFGIWVVWPRKAAHDPYAQPHGWEER